MHGTDASASRKIFFGFPLEEFEEKLLEELAGRIKMENIQIPSK